MQCFDAYDSPLGQIILTCEDNCLTSLFFTGQKYAEGYLSSDAVQGICPVLVQTREWLDRYFRGNIPGVLPALKLKGTPFQKRVWNLLQQIPYGETVTYGELAKKLRCKSAQAVGGAVGRNPISILIPCHRVMGAGGKLTGYAGGVEKKEYLLKLEKDHR